MTTTELPDIADFDLGDRPAWERQPGEPTKVHAAFRIYRDLPTARRSIEDVALQVDSSPRRVYEWAARWDWRERTQAWEDACHRIEDQERLDAIRSMHSLHRKAGRAVMNKALQALSLVDADRIPVGQLARLLELGARLERSTLIVSVEELQGLDLNDDDGDDPWDVIARELDPSLSTVDSATIA
jgi:hypothetical protein